MSEATPETSEGPAQGTEQKINIHNEDGSVNWREAARKWEAEAKRNPDIAEMRKLKAQLEELRPQADQFRLLEEASKSEAQRLQEAAETARREAETARTEAVRYKAAALHGISADHFDLLGTGSEDEVTARAEKLSALIAAQQARAAAPPSRPVEQLRPGATPGEVENEDDALYNQLFPNQ